MRAATPPIRFLAVVAVLWIGGRIWWLLPESAREDIVLPTRASATASLERHGAHGVVATRARSILADIGASGPAPALAAPAAPAILPRPGSPPNEERILPASIQPLPPPAADLPVPPPSIESGRSQDSRWSGNFYLFTREGGSDALGAGGQLGGGQAGARLAWQLNRNGPARFALAARVYTPLDDVKGTEAAAGLDFHPLPGRPLRLSIERRFDLGGRGRNAWSAYAAGGFWRELGAGMEVDGYAQAGVVGAQSADFFTDGAVRLVHRRDVAAATALRLGGGMWGGAQPGVERIDIGPRAAISLPVAGTTLTAAIEGRIRVAGDADPGSGVALTLASDF